MTDISMVIATYNRSILLSHTFRSLCRIRMPEGIDWEVIVVDNNSQDKTKETIELYKSELPVKSLFERQQGKTFALNHALMEARGDLLLFTDDDATVDPVWAEALIDAASAFPDFGWFGGRVKPDWGESRPEWYSQETAAALSGYFGDYDLGPTSRPYTPADKLPLGASLAIRREIFEKIGGFRTDLGPRGSLRGVGDETEFLDRAIAAGFKGYYVAEACVLHHVSSERLKLSGFLNYGIGKGLNQYRIGTENGRKGSMFRAASQMLRAAPQILKGRGDRARICLINVGIELGRIKASREKAA